jgi:ankyrin repeat protein
LHIAAIKNKPANIGVLLAFRANLHAKTQKEKVDALYLACAHGSRDAIKQLVAKGGKPDSTAPNGWTAVHVAAINGRDAVLQLLHDLGKDLSPLCPDGTPLDFARIHKRDATVQLLTRLGAKKGATLSVHLSARHGDIEALDGWVKRNRANVHFRKKNRATPLHWAAETDQAEAAELLLNHGADKTARTDGGWTPLHSAAAKGSTNVITLLLKRRAPVNAISQSGTPLDLAKGYRQPEAAALLQAKRGRAGREVSIHMAAAPKSGASSEAIWAAMADVREGRTHPIPKQLISGMKAGRPDDAPKYVSPHTASDGVGTTDYLGVDTVFYRPTTRGAEADAARRLDEIEKKRNRLT